MTAYTLALVAGMLPAGLIGDRYGRKTLMVGALALFAAGSAGCAFAPNPELFIAARVALGLAGAAIIVMALSIITVLFDEDERPRAIGIWGAANFIGLPLGPILGGWILTNVWWGWIFLLNVPVALVAMVAVLVLVPDSRSAERPGIDVAGVVLSSVGLVALMYGVVEAGDHGWGEHERDRADGRRARRPRRVRALGAPAHRRPRRAAARSISSLFRSRSFTWGVLLTAFGVFGLFGVLFALPQYFQAIMGVDPQGSGFRLLPVVVGLLVGAVTADRVAARIGAKLTVAIGFAVVVRRLGRRRHDDRARAGMGSSPGGPSSSASGGGLGFATAASAALVELSAERSGVGVGAPPGGRQARPGVRRVDPGQRPQRHLPGQVAVAGLPAAAAATVQAASSAGSPSRSRSAHGAARIGPDGVRARHGRRGADHRGRRCRRDRARPRRSCRARARGRSRGRRRRLRARTPSG